MSRAFERVMIILMLLLLCTTAAVADPTGAVISSNTTQTATPATAGTIQTAGGTFTTLILNASTQTPRWKAYVGNATGSFSLDDANNATIYDWNIASISGEVYTSRNSSVDWASIRCANTTILQAEQNALNITTTREDSINRTFNNTVHRSFFVGTTPITNSTCRAIATYVNNTRQAISESATFQEVLLDDTQRFVYATLLEDGAQGYNNGLYDFQMIVAESEFAATPSTYYFWVELS